MKKNRILSFVLVLMMAVSCVVTGYAAEATYTESEILTNTSKGDSHDFTKMSLAQMEACISSKTRLDVASDDGVKLTVNSSSTTNGDAVLSGLNYSETATKAVKFSFVAPDEGTTVDVSLIHNNKRVRIFTYFYDNKWVIGCGRNSFSDYEVTPGEIYTVIAREEVADKISVYVKDSSASNYTRIFALKDVWVGTNWGDMVRMSVSGDSLNDYAIYKDITFYVDEVTYSEATILNGFTEDQKIDFTQITADEVAAYGTAGTNAVTVKDNGLRLTVGDDSSKSYGEINLGLTYSLAEGEAVKLSFMPTTESDNVLVIADFQGNGERLKVRTEVYNGKQVLVYHTGEDGSGSARGISAFEIAANKSYDVIAKKNQGKIDLYAKEDTDSEYKLILSEQPVYSVAENASCYKLHIAGASGSSAVFKGVTTFAKERVPYTEAVILGNVTKAYAVDFAVPGSTGVELANLGAAYNVSADASLLEYTATEEGLKISDHAKDDAFPGFEFQKTGFLPKLENGAFKMEFELDATKPGRFELAFNSALENFSINADLTEDLKLRLMMQDKSYYTDSEALIPGMHYTYIFKRNASVGTISVFVKSAQDEYYREVITYVPPTATSGLIRLRGMKQIEGAYTLKELVQYLNQIPEKTVLTNEAEIQAEGDKMFFADSFNEKKEMWTIGTNNVSNGVMVLDKETGFSPESLKIDLTTPFTVRFRHKPATDSSTIFYYRSGDKRVYLGKYPRELFVGNSLRASNHALPQIGVWYEYLFDFDGKGKVDIYNRREGVAQWSAISTNLDLTSGTNGELTFGGVGDLMDDLSIYHGAGVKLEKPVVSGSEIKLDGYIAYGAPESTYNRRAKVMVIAYNKEYGFTEKIWDADVIAEAGEMTNISQNFNAAGINTDSNFSAMVWDDETTIIPMSKVAGYTVENQASGVSNDPLTYEINHNEILLRGFIGKGNQLTATLLKGTEMKAALQLEADKNGMIDTFLAVDPATCPSGEYTLRIAYGEHSATDYSVKLACNNIGYELFDDATDFVNYINQYTKNEFKVLVANQDFAVGAYSRFVEIRENGAINDFYAFRNAVEKAVKDEKDERDVVSLVNAASSEKKWSVIQTLVTETYRDFLGTDITVLADIRDLKSLFLKMTGITYTGSGDIMTQYLSAVQMQKQQESAAGGFPVTSPGGVAGGGAAGGGGFGGGAVGVQTEGVVPDELLDNTMGIIELQEQFPDIEVVPWAIDSINTLQRAWIISGDENGNFNPNTKITREEFLKILMGVSGISLDEMKATSFRDVDQNAWYAGYVNGAYQLGIVNGISEERFGIGEPITRADMAVMIKRVLDYKHTEAKAVKPAFLFDDFETIPAYARESISCLAEAELLNGVGENRFMPMSNTTRAEAAVAICRIYELLG